jgi:hypothetical protein
METHANAYHAAGYSFEARGDALLDAKLKLPPPHFTKLLRSLKVDEATAEYYMLLANVAAAGHKHYWLTPPDLYAELEREFGPFDFDPCPYPRPKGFDGLKVDWGQCNYVNPMFQGGVTAWVKKAIAEHQKGKTVVMVFPLDGWIHMLLKAGAKIRSIGNVKWLATEDGTPAKGSARPIAAFILQNPDDAKFYALGECLDVLYGMTDYT